MTPAVPEDVDDKVHPVRPDEKGLFKIQEDLEHISPRYDLSSGKT